MTTKKKAQGGSKGKATKTATDAETARAERNARIVRGLWEDADLPEFITNAVMTSLHLAKEKTGVEFWQVEPENIMGEDFDMTGLANLLRVAYRRSDIEVEPVRDLAGLVSAVLTHDEVPNLIYDKLTDALVELHDSTDVYQDPAAVRALLDYHARRRGENGQAEEGGKGQK